MVNDLITDQLILLDVVLPDRRGVIEAVADLMLAAGRVSDRDRYVQDVLLREAQLDTSIGGGIALPHARSAAARRSSLAFLRLREPIEWGESQDVRLIFGIAVPEANAEDEHLKILSSVARRLLDDDLRKVIEHSAEKREIMALLSQSSEDGSS